MELDIAQTIDVLNNGDAEAIEQYLLQVDPNAFARGRVYTTGLALYNLLEEQLAGSSVDELLSVHSQLTYAIWRRNVLFLAMEELLANDKAAEAEALIARLDEAYTYQGYRVLLRYYAKKGDLENYRRVLKRSDRRRARNELIRIERDFVAAYAQKMGVEAALGVIDQSKPWLVQEALEAQVGRMPYAEIHRWAEDTLADQERPYVQVHLKALERELEQGAPVAGIIVSLLAYINEIEPGQRIKGSNYTVRQQALWQLGTILLNAGLLDQVRQIIKSMSNSSSKRDLAKRLKDRETGAT